VTLWIGPVGAVHLQQIGHVGEVDVPELGEGEEGGAASVGGARSVELMNGDPQGVGHDRRPQIRRCATTTHRHLVIARAGQVRHMRQEPGRVERHSFEHGPGEVSARRGQ
jgi:hypothetical protein